MVFIYFIVIFYQLLWNQLHVSHLLVGHTVNAGQLMGSQFVRAYLAIKVHHHLADQNVL